MYDFLGNFRNNFSISKKNANFALPLALASSPSRHLNNMKNKKLFGTLCGILAAICYGTNNFGAVNLRNLGMGVNSTLFFRFSIAWVIIAVVMAFRKESVKVSKREFLTLTGLGVLFAISSLSLYLSFLYMDSGVASTILFVYPVMTAALMAIFFKERMTPATITALVLSMLGVVLLDWNGGGFHLNALGVVLVLISALSYALYIIVMDRGRLVMSSFKINFYVLAYCTLGQIIYSLIIQQPIMMPQGQAWFYVGWLAIVPAIFALMLMVYAAKYVGSTVTAILGALEPLTAVMIGIMIFGESFNLQLALGIALILSAVCIIALKPSKRE